MLTVLGGSPQTWWEVTAAEGMCSRCTHNWEAEVNTQLMVSFGPRSQLRERCHLYLGWGIPPQLKLISAQRHMLLSPFVTFVEHRTGAGSSRGHNEGSVVYTRAHAHTHTYTKSSQQEAARIPYKTSNFFLGSIANDPMTSNKTLPLKGIAAFHSDTLSTKLPVCRSLIHKPDSNHSSPHLSRQMQSHASIGSYGSSGQGASVQDPQDPYHRQLPADQWAISQP